VGLTVREAYVDLTVWGHEHGHAIGQPVHVADRWIAASAIAWGLVLATTDGIFDGIDGLQLMNLPEPN
jgi:predicted nucleic acid-binding protein